MRTWFAILLLAPALCLAQPDVSVGVVAGWHSEDVEAAAVGSGPKLGYSVRAGWDGWPVYAVAGFEALDNSLLGQPLGEMDVLSVGLGVKKKWGDVSAFLEVGQAFIDESTRDNIRQEIVYTHLVGNHWQPGRPIPVTGRVHSPYGYDTTYELEDALFFRLGVRYNLTEHLAVTGAYRALYAEEEMTLKDRPFHDGQGYWREDDRLNLSAIEAGIEWNF
jgi:hypothetical protein